MFRLLTCTFAMLLAVESTSAQTEQAKTKAQTKAPPERPTPTAADVAYGDHPRQRFDFWPAKSDKPTPLVVLIHGGGWINGDKSGFGTAAIKPFLDAGISVASINYRFIDHAMEQKVEPPVKAPLHDAARAIQFMRSKAKEWNLDKSRVGATGGSAGACTSLWLALHDDLANPASDDSIARESTRLTAAAVNGAQTSLDPKQVQEWMPNANYGGHAFRIYQAGGEAKEQATFTRVVFPDRFRLDDVWHSGSASDFVRGDAGYRIDIDGTWPMDQIVRREFIKSFRRNPLVLLKARNEPGYRAVATGRGKVGEQDVEWLSIGLDGATSTLGIDASTGRVLSIRYRGRAPAAIGDVTRTFSDFHDIGGGVLPFAVTTTYNDAPAGEPRPFATVTVNAKLDAKLFATPE